MVFCPAAPHRSLDPGVSLAVGSLSVPPKCSAEMGSTTIVNVDNLSRKVELLQAENEVLKKALKRHATASISQRMNSVQQDRSAPSSQTSASEVHFNEEELRRLPPFERRVLENIVAIKDYDVLHMLLYRSILRQRAAETLLFSTAKMKEKSIQENVCLRQRLQVLSRYLAALAVRKRRQDKFKTRESSSSLLEEQSSLEKGVELRKKKVANPIRGARASSAGSMRSNKSFELQRSTASQF